MPSPLANPYVEASRDRDRSAFLRADGTLCRQALLVPLYRRVGSRPFAQVTRQEEPQPRAGRGRDTPLWSNVPGPGMLSTIDLVGSSTFVSLALSAPVIIVRPSPNVIAFPLLVRVSTITSNPQTLAGTVKSSAGRGSMTGLSAAATGTAMAATSINAARLLILFRICSPSLGRWRLGVKPARSPGANTTDQPDRRCRAFHIVRMVTREQHEAGTDEARRAGQWHIQRSFERPRPVRIDLR